MWKPYLKFITKRFLDIIPHTESSSSSSFPSLVLCSHSPPTHEHRENLKLSIFVSAFWNLCWKISIFSGLVYVCVSSEAEQNGKNQIKVRVEDNKNTTILHRDGNYSQWRNKNNQKQKFSSMMFFLANTQKLFQRHIKKLFFYRKCIWKFSALFFSMPRHGTQKSVVFVGVGEFSPHFPCFLGDSEPPSWCAPAGECLQSFEIHYGGV